jgi:hypothetical protein
MNYWGLAAVLAGSVGVLALLVLWCMCEIAARIDQNDEDRGFGRRS